MKSKKLAAIENTHYGACAWYTKNGCLGIVKFNTRNRTFILYKLRQAGIICSDRFLKA